MNVRLFLIFAALTKAVLIYPGSIRAQVAVMSVTHTVNAFGRIDFSECVGCNKVQDPGNTVLKCPANLTICECTIDETNGPFVNCKQGGNQMERELVAVKEESRQEGRNGPVDLPRLLIQSTNVQKFDLALLAGFAIRKIRISPEQGQKSALKELIGGPGQTTNVFKNAEMVSILSHPGLDDSGLGDTLKAFSASSSLVHLSLNKNGLVGNEDEDSEFLPGFSSLVFLQELDLGGNKIKNIFWRQFQHLSRLAQLNLAENKIVTVQGNIFFAKTIGKRYFALSYDLRDNFINEISFQDKNSLSVNLTSNYFMFLELERNKLSSLPIEIFHEFLQANDRNVIYLGQNPLVCDRRISWLKDNDNYSTQIENARCWNLQKAPLFKKTENDNSHYEKLCPKSEEIEPCACKVFLRSVDISCEGDLILQENIDNLIQVLRLHQQIPPNQPLDIQSYKIINTNLTELDLTMLFGVKMRHLNISENKLLTKMNRAQMIPGAIDVEHLILTNNTKLDDEGLGDTLKLFSPALVTLSLSGNSLRGHFKVEANSTRVDTMEREFFPGLAQLRNLTVIFLYNNKIQQLGVRRFYNNVQLGFLGLGNNMISKVQKNVFSRRNNCKETSRAIAVDLRGNFLAGNSFPLNFLGSCPAILGLQNNYHIQLSPHEYYYFLYRDDFGPRYQKQWRAVSLGLIYENDTSNSSSSSSSLVCPDAGEIFPCTCIENYAEIVCNGSSVNQTSVEILFQKLNDERQKSKNKSKLEIQKFKIFDTPITEFDLSPLIDCRISTLFIFENFNLTKITAKNNSNRSSIIVKELIVESNPNLVDSGIENLLTNFESSHLEILSLAENSLVLRKPLKGLSTLKNLKRLSFRANKIVQLPPEFLDGVINQKLQHLDLSENRIEKIRQSAFGSSIDEVSDKIGQLLVINLNFNPTTENAFPLNDTGLEKLQRSIQLNLVHSKMTTLPIFPFNGVLTRENGNFRIDLYGNPLNCDWRLNWLENTTVFGSSSSSIFVDNAECINKPGEFIQNYQKSDPGDFCAEMKNLFPCSCSSSSSKSLECVGDQVEDEQFQNFVSNIRRIDPFCSKTFPQLDNIVIRSTKLTTLNLTSIFDLCLTNLTSFVVDSNLNLTKIVGPLIMMQFIKVQNLEITSNPLTDEGLGSTLQYFSPQMETLKLNGNQLKGHLTGEFLPGFSNLKNLERVELTSNQIVRLPGGLFKNKLKLSHILLSDNKISEIHRNAFDFKAEINETLTIDLSLNFLTDDSLHPKMFDGEIFRPLNIDLRRNRFTTIPADPFQRFLETNPANQLDFKDNFLECNAKLDWIKKQKEALKQSGILNAECEGDSIFYSKYFNSFVEKVTDEGVLTIVLSIVIPAILILILVAFFLWKKFKRARDLALYLSAKDIDEFRKGNSNLNPEDLHAAVMSRPFDENLEIPREALEYDEKKVLGEGAYGIVFKGILKATAGNTCVALKTVTASADLETFKSLLSEIKILVFLGSHQNIVQLLGATTVNIRKRDALAILEFCQNGDLRSYLLGRKNNFQDAFAKNSKDATNGEPTVDLQTPYENFLTTVQLVKFAMGIANGLKFLRLKNVIHGDLAARNILLTDNLEAKISDFGLSRQMINYQNYLKSTVCPLPFKWMSIEAIKDMDFSICSDIWSFGVVLFEIFSLGDIPYPGLAVDQDFLPRLEQGYRMGKPKFANQKIYELMLDTWKLASLDRPSSEEILCRLNEILGQITRETKSNSGVYIEC